MTGESVSERAPARLEYIIGWILGLVCLVAFFFSPNIKMTNGDTHGWAGYLEEYASAEGTIFYPTEPKRLGPRVSRFTEDELREMGRRERSAGWWVIWNPHHLLYLPVTAVMFRLVRQVLPPLRGFTFLHWWNSLVSAGIVLLFYRLLIRMVPGSPYPLAWCVFLASSPTFFRYATDGAQYPTAIFFLAVSSGGLWAFASKPGPIRLYRAGFWLAVAVLFHQILSIAVPFILIGIALLINGMRKRGEAASWKWFWWTAAIAVGVPVLTYVMIAALALGPSGEFSLYGLFKYATLYGSRPAYWNLSIWDGLGANLVTFVGFYFDNERTRMMFLQIQSAWFTALVAIVPAMWVTALIGFRKVSGQLRWWMGCCLLWVLPYLVFLSFWNPGHDFYHLFMVIPLGCLAVAGAESAKKPGKRALLDAALMWVWILIAVYVNLPYSLAGSSWI